MMDFIIKTSYAAAELHGTAISNSSPTVKGFFDDNRVVIMSLTFCLSFITFLWQIYKHFKDRSDRKKEYGLSIEEGYWHQSVVLPLFVDKFVLYITQWVDMINNPNKTIDEIRDNFKKEIRELTSRTQFLCTVDQKARENIRTELDGIEDCITCYLSDIKESTDNKRTPPNDKVFSKVEMILKELMKDHQRFSK